MAAKNGCSESAQMLIVHGASLEAKTNVSSIITSVITMTTNNFYASLFFSFPSRFDIVIILSYITFVDCRME